VRRLIPNVIATSAGTMIAAILLISLCTNSAATAKAATVPMARTTESPTMKSYQKRPNALSRLRGVPLLEWRYVATLRIT
jgi:hypothetical protein